MEQPERKCYCTDKNGNLTPITTNVYENNDISEQVTQETENPPQNESINDTGAVSNNNKFMNWFDKVKSNPTEYFKDKMNKVKANPEKYMKQVLSHPYAQKIGQKAMANPHFRELLYNIPLPRPKGGKSRKTRRQRRRPRPRGNPRKTRK
jgi:hypothetical protein